MAKGREAKGLAGAEGATIAKGSRARRRRGRAEVGTTACAEDARLRMQGATNAELERLAYAMIFGARARAMA